MQKLLRFYPSFIAILSLFPVLVSAQSQIDTIIINIQNSFLLFIIPLLFVIATIVFLWGVLKYIIKSDDEKARAQAKSLMLWGIVGLAVISAVWGIVVVIIQYFGISNTPIPRLPGVI